MYAALRSIEQHGEMVPIAEMIAERARAIARGRAMLPSRHFVDLTQPEIAAQLRRNPLVILPAGSVEQHGPHLPTGTDTFAANMIAHAVAEQDGRPRAAGHAVRRHADAHAVRGHDQLYARHLHARHHRDLRLHRQARRQDLMILNWHEGNIPSLAIAAESLHREHGMTVLTVQACYVAEELYGKHCNGLTHGGEIEALAVLAYRPELVHLDRIGHSSDHPHGHQMDKLRRTRSYQPVLTDIRSIAPTGWFGSPQHATAERARACSRTSPTPLPRRRPKSSASSTRAGRHGGDQATAAGALMARLLKQSRGEAAGPARPRVAGAGLGRDRLDA